MNKKEFKRELHIELEYGSEYQAEVFDKVILAFITVLETQMKERHKGNKIKVL